MLAVVLVLALGIQTPLFLWLYHALPGFGQFRGVSKFSFVFLLFAGLLAGFGCERLTSPQEAGGLQDGRSRSAGWALAVAMALWALALVVLPQSRAGWGTMLSAINQYDGQHPTFDVTPQFALDAWNLARRDVATAAASFTLLAGLLWLRRRWKWAGHAVAALALIELSVFAHHNMATFDFDQLMQNCAAWQSTLGKLQGERLYAKQEIGPIMAARGLNAWGDDPLVSRRYMEFIARGQKWSAEDVQANFLKAPVRYTTAYLPLRVKYFVASRGEKIQLYPVNGEAPAPMLVVGRGEVMTEPGAILDRMYQSGFDARRVVLLENEPASGGRGDATLERMPPPRIVVRTHSFDDEDIETDCPTDCFLLITDAYSNGWRARPLEGSVQHDYEVMRADYTLRAIPLRAGHQHLELYYWPPGLTAGLWLSGIAGLAWLAGAAWLWWRAQLGVSST
jgi:hypothetical protein